MTIVICFVTILSERATSEEAGSGVIETNQTTPGNTEPGESATGHGSLPQEKEAAGMPEPLASEDQLQFATSAATRHASLPPAVVETRKLIAELAKQLNDSDGTGRGATETIQPVRGNDQAKEGPTSPNWKQTVQLAKARRNRIVYDTQQPDTRQHFLVLERDRLWKENEATAELAKLVLNQPLPDIPSESEEGHK